MMISEGSKLEEEPLHAFATMKPPPISVAADDVATAGDDERSTPLLFNKLNSAKCKRWRHSAEQHYEMHVVSIDTFLELSTLPPHQELKAAGKLTVYSPALEGRIVFVSHQWLAWESPDPGGVQLVALQTALRRMLAGEMKSIETDWLSQLIFQDFSRVTREDLKRATPHLYLWMDWLSMPQPAVGD